MEEAVQFCGVEDLEEEAHQRLDLQEEAEDHQDQGEDLADLGPGWEVHRRDQLVVEVHILLGETAVEEPRDHDLEDRMDH